MNEYTEQIFKIAEEIGSMLKDTDEYREFERGSLELSRSESEKDLLERYAELEGSIRQRRETADIIEPFVLDEAASLRDSVVASTTIMAYLAARDRYVALLERVQNELVSSDD